MLTVNVRTNADHSQTLHNALDLLNEHYNPATHVGELSGKKVEKRILKQLLPILFNEYMQRMNNPEVKQ